MHRTPYKNKLKMIHQEATYTSTYDKRIEDNSITKIRAATLKGNLYG